MPDGSKPLFDYGHGGFAGATFASSVTEEIEGEVVWSRSATGDSLGCGPVVNDLNGKFALIRRGECSFLSKCANALQAGAKAVIVLNHYGDVLEDENIVKAMVDNSGSVPVPCIFVCRKLGDPHYLPSNDLGLSQVAFYSNLLTENEDTARHEFRVTENFWASDNGKIIPGGILWNFINWDFPTGLPLLLSSSKLSISPNPSSGVLNLNLHLDSTNQKVEISMFNLQGNLVLSTIDKDFQSGSIEMDVSRIPSGAYIIWVRTEEGNTMRKIMICY